MTENCSNCGREINSTEQACVFKGEIVCIDCDEKMRQDTDLSISKSKMQKDNIDNNVVNEVNQNDQSVDNTQKRFTLMNIIGFIVAACFLIGAVHLLTKRVYTPHDRNPLRGRLLVDGLIGSYQILSPDQSPLEMKELYAFYTWIFTFVDIIIGLGLLFRSFLPRFKFWQGLLIIVCGYWLGYMFGQIGYAFNRWGQYATQGGIWTVALVGLIAVPPMILAFRTKKRTHCNKS